MCKGFLVGSQGEGLGDKSAPVWVGLLDGEGWGPGDVTVEEWGADSIEGHSLSQANDQEGSKAGLLKKHLAIEWNDL